MPGEAVAANDEGADDRQRGDRPGPPRRPIVVGVPDDYRNSERIAPATMMQVTIAGMTLGLEKVIG